MSRPASCRCFLRHPRPGKAEVSLRHLSGSVIGGCRSSNLDLERRDARNASIERHRYPQPTDSCVSMRALGLVPDGKGRLSVRQGFCSFAREAWPLARTHACHVFSLTSCPARDPRSGSLALASLNRACRNLVSTFPQRSPPWLLTTAACGGLRSTPDCRPRRACLHLSYSYASPFGPALLVTQDP